MCNIQVSTSRQLFLFFSVCFLILIFLFFPSRVQYCSAYLRTIRDDVCVGGGGGGGR